MQQYQDRKDETMNKQAGVSFEVWFEEFKRVVKCCAYTDVLRLDEKAYRIAYDANMTPAEEMLEEMSYA